MPDGYDPHIEGVFPTSRWSRRGFVAAGGIVAGFSAAVGDLAAQTIITTSAAGLEAGEIKFKTADGDLPGYRARPSGAGPFPTILVVQEIFGVHEHIRDICRRFAKLGYLAIAPELYARQGDVTKLTTIDEARAVAGKVPDAQVMSDLDAAVQYASTDHGDTNRLGITGFCWGGRITWLYTAHSPKVKAGVAWYGALRSGPIAQAGKLHAPVLGLYGAADAGIPVESVEEMRAACKTAHKTCEIVVYPDAPHAFHADYRASYREGPAKDGWAKAQAWFKQHGVA